MDQTIRFNQNMYFGWNKDVHYFSGENYEANRKQSRDICKGKYIFF